MQISTPPLYAKMENPVIKTMGESDTLLNLPSPSTEKITANSNPLSGVSAFALSIGISELNFNRSETNLGFRKDNSLALKASSTMHFNLKTEQFKFELTISAEALGLKPSMFADPSQPLTINLRYHQSQMAVNHTVRLQEIKTIRSPQEIIQDLVEGLNKALQDPENKSICYHLDEEAVASLVQSDQKMAKLFSELVMIMNMVNLMKKQNEPSHDYVILLSGKGSPYLDVQEDIEVDGLLKEYEFKLTILPPKTETAENAAYIAAENPESPPDDKPAIL